MDNSKRQQIIALAAVTQSVLLIQDLSRGKILEQSCLITLLNGVMSTSPDSALDVYTSLEDLTDGAEFMVMQLAGKSSKRDVIVTRYLSGIMAISKKLLNSPKALTELKQELDKIERRLEHFDIEDTSVIENFADIYSKVVSPLTHKIQIIGRPELLTQKSVQNKIRALLLAGVRAAVLWRQLGGQRRQFLFNRKQILQNAIAFHKELSINI